MDALQEPWWWQMMFSTNQTIKIRADRYASFNSGEGKSFEEGKLSLEELRRFAVENGEPEIRSGKQEYLENIINRFI
jgi:xylose isomerase